MFGAGLVSMIGGITAYLAGPGSAFTAMKAGAKFWEGTQPSWKSWESSYRRPQKMLENYQAGSEAGGMESMLDSASAYHRKRYPDDDYGRSYAHFKEVW